MAQIVPIQVDSIVMEASTSEDRKFMRNMKKEDVNQINATLVQKLYESVLKHNKCDFGDIPKSKGDITKVKGIETCIESLDTLKELHQTNGIPVEDIDTVKNSISIVSKFKRQFETGFKLNNEYLIILYNTIVMAIMDGTSMLIADYTNYMITPDNVEYSGVSGRNKKRGTISIESLKRFNSMDASGSLSSTINTLVSEATKSSAGTRRNTGVSESAAVLGSIGVITAVAFLSVKAVITLVRELIFYFYHLRVTLADYLEVQATFLEMNRLAIENSNRPASQKKDIIKKQEKVILKLRRVSDKLKIKAEDVTVLSKKSLNEDNSTLSLSSIEKQMTEDKLNGVNTIQII